MVVLDETPRALDIGRGDHRRGGHASADTLVHGTVGQCSARARSVSAPARGARGSPVSCRGRERRKLREHSPKTN